MPMTDDETFRKVTLELFSGTDVAASLHRALQPITQVIQANHIFLQIYESGLGAMRTLAVADIREGRISDSLTPMPEETRQLVNRHLSAFVEGAAAISDPDRNPVARDMLSFHGIEDRSVLNMLLQTDIGRLGSVVLTAAGEKQYADEDVRRFSTLYRPFSILLAKVLEQRELQSLRERLSDDNRFLNRELLRLSGDRIIGADFGLREVTRQIRKVAAGDSPVLITGETGVGKDVVAGAIHVDSRRSHQPFIAVNCGAIPESLVDSELFGHEKGAFTGALSEKRGRFERADGGTIFLDEIGEMPLSAQVRLLRVLQEMVVERVGGTTPIPTDVRIIAATNRDLPELIRTGRFREDLWYRLNVFPIHVPPLRDRPDDIPALVDYFIGRKTDELKLPQRPIPAPGALEVLAHYSWPGNVRELANVVERSIILSTDGLLRFHAADPDPAATGESGGSPVSLPSMDTAGADGPFPTLDEVTADHIKRALEHSGGKVHGPGGAGDLLGINPNTLRHRMRNLGITFGREHRA